MTTRKFGRTALIAVLALSIIMSITGGTIAWFTDEVTSANNVITAGNLDVELYHTNKTITTEEKVDAATELFDDVTRWEPGVVSYENLTIKNEGNLALKYEMTVNATNENTVIENGKGLSSALQVAVIEDGIAAGASREEVLSQVDTWYDFNAFEARGELLADGKKAHGVVIYWAPKANDNDWNVNNGKKTSDDTALHIDLGVKVVATQLTNEEDSFDDLYDQDASYNGWKNDANIDWYTANPNADEYVLDTAEELAGLAKLVNNGTDTFEGKTIKLGKSINMANRPWTPIGTGEHPFNGTFDGNNMTISNVTLDQNNLDPTSLVNNGDDYGYAQGFFGVIGWQTGDHKDEKVTIKNLKLEVSFETDKAYVMGGLVGSDAAGHKGSGRNSSLACDIEISNITVNGKIISTNDQSGATVGGVAGKLYTKGNIMINGCTNNATVSAETEKADNKVGGILGFYSGANSAVITQNTNNGDVTSKSGRSAGCKAAGICITGSTAIGVNISNNTNNGDITGTEYAVAAIAFSGNDSPIYKMSEYTTQNNANTGKLYTLNYQTFEKADVLYTYLVYGGKSQTPANNTTDDVKDANGNPVLEININN